MKDLIIFSFRIPSLVHKSYENPSKGKGKGKKGKGRGKKGNGKKENGKKAKYDESEDAIVATLS